MSLYAPTTPGEANWQRWNYGGQNGPAPTPGGLPPSLLYGTGSPGQQGGGNGFYDPFPQYGTGIDQAQQWSMGQQQSLPGQPPPYGSRVETTGGGPLLQGLQNLFGGIRDRRRMRQLARQGVNPFTGQPGNTIEAQPEMPIPSRENMARTAAPAPQNMGSQPQNMGNTGFTGAGTPGNPGWLTMGYDSFQDMMNNPYQQLAMMYGMGGLGGMLGGQGGYGGYGMGGYGGQMNMLPFLQAMASPMGNYMGQMMPYGTRNQAQRQRLGELVQSGNLFGNRGNTRRGSRVPRGAY